MPLDVTVKFFLPVHPFSCPASREGTMEMVSIHERDRYVPRFSHGSDEDAPMVDLEFPGEERRDGFVGGAESDSDNGSNRDGSSQSGSSDGRNRPFCSKGLWLASTLYFFGFCFSVLNYYHNHRIVREHHEPISKMAPGPQNGEYSHCANELFISSFAALQGYTGPKSSASKPVPSLLNSIVPCPALTWLMLLPGPIVFV